ncbi:MAG: hypothetical protein ACJ748_01265 [Flavisolibacter sp.]
MNWKELLKRLKLDYVKETAPGFFELSGGYKLQIKPYKDNTANGLTSCIEDFIKHQGGYVNRINTTGIMRKIGGEMKWTKGNSNKGAFDLRFVYQGKSGDVEIKIGKDRMSEAQIREMERIKKAGGLAFVAKDFPSFLQWWEEIGFTIPEYQTVK